MFNSLAARADQPADRPAANQQQSVLRNLLALAALSVPFAGAEANAQFTSRALDNVSSGNSSGSNPPVCTLNRYDNVPQGCLAVKLFIDQNGAVEARSLPDLEESGWLQNNRKE